MAKILTKEELRTLYANDLSRSGLVPEDVPNWQVMDGREAKKFGPGHEQDRAGYCIFYNDLDGNPVVVDGHQYCRFRFLQDDEGFNNRYWGFSESVDSMRGSHLYIPSRFKESFLAADEPVLIITEGEKKAEKGCLAGIPTVAIPGIEMWRDPVALREKIQSLVAGGGVTEADALHKIKEDRESPVIADIMQVIGWCAEQRSRLVVAVLFDSDGAEFDKQDIKLIEKGKLALPTGKSLQTWVHPDTSSVLSVLNTHVRQAGWYFAWCLRRQIPDCTDAKVPVQALFCPHTMEDEEVLKNGLDDWLVREPTDKVWSTIKSKLHKSFQLRRVVSTNPIFGCSNIDPDLLPLGDGDKLKMTADSVLERLLDSRNMGIAGDTPGELFQWGGSAWSIVPINTINIAVRHALSQLLPTKNNDANAKSCVSALSKSRYAYDIPTPASGRDFMLIALRDKVVELNADGGMYAAEPVRELGLRHFINADYADLQQPTPLFDKFFSEVLPDPAVREAVLEFIGYTLFSDTRFEVAQLWTGSGRNGKTTLSTIVEKLHSNVVSLSLDDLQGFGASQLMGASLVSIDETPTRINEQKTKALVSGSLIDLNRKFRDTISIRPTAKIIVRCNEPPAISDQSDGFWRRFDIVKFEAEFDKGSRDPNLATKIIKQELSGITGKVLASALRLLQRGELLPTPEKMAAAKADIRRETNSVRAWGDEVELVLIDNTQQMPKGADVYGRYSEWCKKNGYMAVSSGKFWRQLGGLDGLKALDTKVRMQIGGLRVRVCNIQSKSPLYRFPTPWEDEDAVGMASVVSPSLSH